MPETTEFSRRDIIAGSSALAAGTVISSAPAAAQAMARARSQKEVFNLTRTFAGCMKEIGGAIGDAGGKVTFTGADPIIRSHFRVGSAMAIPAMGAALARLLSGASAPARAFSTKLRE